MKVRSANFGTDAAGRCMRVLRRAAFASIVALVSCARSGPLPNVLVFAGPGAEPDTLNPLLTRESDAADFAGLYMPVLFNFDQHDRYVPEVAVVVPTRRNGGISADGLTIMYHLRPGVVWQDGFPLTARDIVFTYSAIMNPRNNVDGRSGYDLISNVRAIDPHTVVVHLRRPFAPLISQFMNSVTYPILPAHLLSRYRDLNEVPYNALPIGAGPFKVVEWIRGDHVTLAANPRYWRGRPHIDKLVFRFIPNPGTAASELRTGEIGAWFNADPEQYATLAGAAVKLTRAPINDIHMILLNLRDPVLGDRRVRQAIAMALDRKLITLGAAHGLGTRVDADQPTFSWAYAPHKDSLAFDPVTASRLLDEAGWVSGSDGIRTKDGRRLEIRLAGTEDVFGWRSVAVLTQSELRRVGIAVSVKTFAPGVFFGSAAEHGVLLSGDYQLAYDARLLGSDPDDDSYYGCDQVAPVGENIVFWCNRLADAAMRDALTTYDINRRHRDYSVVQTEIEHDVPIIPLWQVQRLDAFSVPLAGFAPSPFGSTFWNAWAWRLTRN